MIVGYDRRKASKDIADLQAGDLVKRVLHRGVGLVESDPEHGFVWVSWKDGRREYLPVAALRKIIPGGSEYDKRKK
jgi:hypothetical protein